jgi:hypothetical protein
MMPVFAMTQALAKLAGDDEKKGNNDVIRLYSTTITAWSLQTGYLAASRDAVMCGN